jgi:hypothetical protein
MGTGCSEGYVQGFGEEYEALVKVTDFSPYIDGTIRTVALATEESSG